MKSNGPLRRNVVFMEQSPLLQVVQSKLCAAPFSDVTGAQISCPIMEAFLYNGLAVYRLVRVELQSMIVKYGRITINHGQ